MKLENNFIDHKNELLCMWGNLYANLFPRITTKPYHDEILLPIRFWVHRLCKWRLELYANRRLYHNMSREIECMITKKLTYLQVSKELVIAKKILK